jgi:predicted 3-demethylubiquinone-9 3-methyltransferase (glyoxalase superfamily)/dihydrofolate reductase
MAKLSQKIVPFLWYVKEAEDAARFYASVFPDSRVDRVTPLPAESPSGPAGSVSVVEFTLLGQTFMAMSAGPLDPFNHAISFMVLCDNQQELDRYWNGLLAGGQPEQCGWLRDKYGVCWQIVPAVFGEMMADKDKTKAKRVAEAMLKMVKFDIDAQKAFEAADHGMGNVRFSVTTSLDGFVAGPEQSVAEPLGIGGTELHRWAIPLVAWRAAHGLRGGEENASSAVVKESQANVGAFVMGRNMFVGHPGTWRTPPWNGWWGDDPPFHAAVFVVTHHVRAPLPMQGGTTFHFVTGVRQRQWRVRGSPPARRGAHRWGEPSSSSAVGGRSTRSASRWFRSPGRGRSSPTSAMPAAQKQVRAVEAPATHLQYRVLR